MLGRSACVVTKDSRACSFRLHRASRGCSGRAAQVPVLESSWYLGSLHLLRSLLNKSTSHGVLLWVVRGCSSASPRLECFESSSVLQAASCVLSPLWRLASVASPRCVCVWRALLFIFLHTHVTTSHAHWLVFHTHACMCSLPTSMALCAFSSRLPRTEMVHLCGA